VATFDEARRHFVDLALVLRQKFSGALVSVISQYVGLHFRKVYEQGCDLQMVSATSPAGLDVPTIIFCRAAELPPRRRVPR
jgi:hypothetical protein